MAGVRLVPEGCDYLLRGETVLDADGSGDGEWLTIRATAPGETPVVVRVARDARGVTLLADGTLSLHNVAVAAAAVRPDRDQRA